VRVVRAEQVQATRELIMTAAERLFAEHGVAAVSARQIGEAAGQGNTAAVGYHFGTKTGLVEAIIRKHASDIERIRTRMAAGVSGSGDLRDWVSCLVRPSTDHLASLGVPTWFARFGAQVLTDPQLRPLLVTETSGTPAIARILNGVDRCLTGLSARVRAERDDMALQLIVHVVASRERVLAENGSVPHESWHDAATGLIDALTGLYQAPVTTRGG
jgi:AcrR family transcriptional regulator